YQIYAHIQPGYFLHGDCTHKRLIELMTPGNNADAVLVQEAVDFIGAAAQRWAGWKLPFANTRIQLFDY
ncbi:hypothetical protein PHYSODRAFT_372769, partial [Phytophthora sojae]